MKLQDIDRAAHAFIEGGDAYYLEETFWKNPYSSDLEVEQAVMVLLAEKNRTLSELLSAVKQQFGPSIMIDEGRLENMLRRMTKLSLLRSSGKEEFELAIPLYREWIRYEILGLEVVR